MRKSRLTSNDVIFAMRDRPLCVVKTHTRVGTVFGLSDLRPIPREVAERMIEKGILVPREASEQSFGLSPSWAGMAA